MRTFGLIGFPLAQSFSKKYFAEKFQQENISDAEFKTFPLETIDQFPELLLREKNIHGLSVTIPHKEKIIPYLDLLSPEAQQIKAVNCIKFFEGKRIGFNTDYFGFKNSLVPLLKPHQKQALVFGSGGASKAVTYVLRNLSIDFKIVSRNKTNEGLTYSEITQQIISKNFLLINTTPLGMFPNLNGSVDIPYNSLGPEHLLYDLIYKPAETEFLLKGKSAGAQIKNGYEMLILQAEKSWEIWNTK
jgi:shikimate dehydrogenase